MFVLLKILCNCTGPGLYGVRLYGVRLYGVRLYGVAVNNRTLRR